MGAAQKKQNMRGFTLMEVLIVVAIIAILITVILPGALKSLRNMKLTELDDSARQIFLTAQNEMTDWKASGKLAELSSDAHSSSDTLTNTQAKTCGFDQAEVLLGTMGGSYLMTINPTTGDVVEVYYSKADISSLQGGIAGMNAASDFDKSNVAAYANESLRMQYGVGYYSGSGSSAAGDISDADKPTAKLEFVNGDDLYIKLTVSGIKDPNTMDFAVTVTGAESGKSLLWEVKNNLIDTPAGNLDKRLYGPYEKAAGEGTFERTYYILLDSLATAVDDAGNTVKNSFDELDGNLIPGEDLMVSATVSCDGTALKPYIPVTTQNSLFETLKDDQSKNTAAVTFANVRQLFNLDVYDNDHKNCAMTANQTADIDFSKYISSKMPFAANGFSRPIQYSPAMLTYYSSISISGFDGEKGETSYRLSNFTLSNGLFGSSSSAQQTIDLNGLWVVNPKANADSGAAGVLIGSAAANTTLSITGCRVWLENLKTENGGRQTYQPVDEEFLSDHGYAVTGTQNVGGLVGISSGKLTITDSFAALPVSGAQNVGGLVGWCAGTLDISNCYTSCAVTASSNTANVGGLVGGLVGSLAGSMVSDTITNCYSTSDVTAADVTAVDGNAGSLVGKTLNSVTLTSCTAYGTVTKGATTKTTYGPMTGSGSVKYTDECWYLSQSGNANVQDCYTADSRPDGLNAGEFSVLVKRTGNTDRAVATYAYSRSGSFPFPTVTSDQAHHGDWPEEERAASTPYGICYYERYSENTYGIYGYDRAGNLIDTLDYEDSMTFECTEVGYGYFGTARPTLQINEAGARDDYTSGTPLTTLGGMNLYRFTSSGTDAVTPGIWSENIPVYDTTTRITYYVNGNYAAAVFLTDQRAAQEKTFQVRTSDQLQAMCGTAQWHFRQTHSIEAKNDTDPLNGRDRQFSFDGENHIISGLKQPLYSTLGNTTIVKNVCLSEVEISTSGNAACLVAGTSQGTITNCHVLSGSVTSTSGNAAGLVASTGGGSVSKCTVTGLTITSTSGAAAGLIVTNDYGTASVSDCKVMKSTITSTSRNENDRAAGLVRTNNEKLQGCSVEECTISCDNHAAGLCVDNMNNGVISGCFVKNGTISSGGGKYPYAAGFVYSNQNGTIQLSYVTGVTLTGLNNDGAASGFVHQNEGSISQCYAYVKTATAKDVSGFVMENSTKSGGGTITDCFAVGSVQSTGGCASGFQNHKNSTGTCTRCYAAVSLSGSTGTVYGFGPNSGTASSCFWCRDVGFNRGIVLTAGAGAERTLNALKNELRPDNTDKIWNMKTSEQTHSTLTGAYPYPALDALDYYGDWPVATGTESMAIGMGVYDNGQKQMFGAYFTQSGAAVNFSSGNGNAASYKSPDSGYILLSGTDVSDWNLTVSSGSWSEECTISIVAAGAMPNQPSELNAYLITLPTGYDWKKPNNGFLGWGSVTYTFTLTNGTVTRRFTYQNKNSGYTLGASS